MLANPSRGHASVKDAMALFDQFLNEMHAYARIADASAMSASNEERRRAHGAYFREHGDEAVAEPSRTSSAPSRPKPTPARPRPAADYRPIPPGARPQYGPGTSGADADDESSRGDGRAA
jgi:hypothetical protein